MEWRIAFLAAMAMALACSPDESRAPSSHLKPLEERTQVSVEQQGCVYGAWSPPVNMGPALSTTDDDFHPATTKDGLSLYFTRGVPGVGSGPDIWVTERLCNDPSCPWHDPYRVPNVNTTANDAVPNITPDGHTMYFHSTRPNGCGAADLYMAHRDDITDNRAWGTPVNLGCQINTARAENGPLFFSNTAAGRQELYFSSTGPPTIPGPPIPHGLGGSDILLSTRPDESFPWPPGEVVSSLSSPGNDDRPAIRQDGLEIIFSSNRVGTIGNTDLWTATRSSTLDDWSNVHNLGPTINTSANDGGAALSFDGKTLYFTSDRTGSLRDLYTSTRPLFCPPSARCRDVTVSADGACQGSASINAGSSDSDTDNDVTCTQSPAGPFALGTTQVTLTCKDQASQQTSSCAATVKVIDTTPPVIVCPANQTLECIGEGAVATFAATARDNCGVASVQCSASSGSTFPEDPSPKAVTCAAVDTSGNQARCGFQIQVRDTLAPVVATKSGANGFIASLWPPDRSLQTISLSDCIASITDQCDGTAPATIVRVTSDELVKTNGKKSEDMVIVDGQTVQLRADRDGSGNGRVYTIFANVTDDDGNTTQVSCKVQVPHDQSGAPAVDSGPLSCVGQGC